MLKYTVPAPSFLAFLVNVMESKTNYTYNMHDKEVLMCNLYTLECMYAECLSKDMQIRRESMHFPYRKKNDDDERDQKR